MAVELARGPVRDLFRDEIHVMAAQKGLFAADDIKIAERACLEVALEAAQRFPGVLVGCLSCHVLTP